MFWLIFMTAGVVMYIYTLDKMDDVLSKCAVYCDEKTKDEYKTLMFYNKVSFVIGFPIIITGILILKIFNWIYSKMES